MTRLLCLRLSFAVACLAATTAARSADEVAPFGEAQALSDDALSDQRGGFTYNGMEIQFGAEIRSYLGNELVMQTNVTWTEMGADIQRTVSAALTPIAPGSIKTGMITGHGLNLAVGDNIIYLANQGQTAFIQRADGAIQNIILNVASGVDIRQEVDARLDVANYAPFQGDILAARVGSALSIMNVRALLGIGSH